jgi:hypothetical protein
MAYTHVNSRGITYYLNECTVTLAGSKKEILSYFFSRNPRKETINHMPHGYEVLEAKSSLPMLRKSGKKK